jgi:crossover junction endodeoxyribonuclease RusA
MILTLPYPPSANVYWRVARGKVIKSNEARTYQEAAGWLAKSQGAELLEGPVCVRLNVYRPQRSGDLDNRIKPLLDSLQGILYTNDDQVEEIHAYRYDDKQNPRVEIEVVPV